MVSKEKLAAYLKQNGVPLYRVKQVLQAIYREGKGSYQDMAVLPKDLRENLEEDVPIFSLKVEKEVSSKNGDTIKTVFKLNDGKFIEAVLMRFKDLRNSVCVSSQVGCPLRCAFCATGASGFSRNLTAEEITDQVLYFDQYLKKRDGRADHVIFMGMGEPFLNYDEVIKAVRSLNDPDLLGIAARHITISTSGIIPGIEKFADSKIQANLAVSLHAPNQEMRAKIMPIAASYKLDRLMDAIKKYLAKTRRRVSYEYVMLKDVNDSEKSAKELAALIEGQLCHVNLIPYNETRLGFQNAGQAKIDRFKKILESQKIPVTVRVSLGQDIGAACGQLAANKKEK